MTQRNPRCYDATKFRQAGLHLDDGKVKCRGEILPPIRGYQSFLSPNPSPL